MFHFKKKYGTISEQEDMVFASDSIGAEAREKA